MDEWEGAREVSFKQLESRHCAHDFPGLSYPMAMRTRSVGHSRSEPATCWIDPSLSSTSMVRTARRFPSSSPMNSVVISP